MLFPNCLEKRKRINLNQKRMPPRGHPFLILLVIRDEYHFNAVLMTLGWMIQSKICVYPISFLLAFRFLLYQAVFLQDFSDLVRGKVGELGNRIY